MMGPRPRGAGGGTGKGPQGASKSPKKSPGKEAAQKRAVKAKEGVVCVLKKRRKEEKLIKVNGSWRPLGPYSVPGGPRKARRTGQGLIGVSNKEKRGALPRPQDSQQKGPDRAP
jgi:hypothetical protein